MKSPGYVHPSLAALALYARRDLPVREQFRIRWHFRNCPACRSEASAFTEKWEGLKREARTENGPIVELSWAQLEREMLGNIAVGVAAARCIENVGRRRVVFRTGWLFAALSVLFVLGWYTHIPPEVDHRILAAFKIAFHRQTPYSGTELDANGDGIAVLSQGTTLRFIHPPSAIVSLAGSSTVSARYVDEDTDQITITRVYAQ